MKTRQGFVAAVLKRRVGGGLENALLDLRPVQSHGRRKIVQEATLDQQGFHNVVRVGCHVVVAVFRSDAVPQGEHLVVLSLFHSDKAKLHEGLLGAWGGREVVHQAKQLGLGFGQLTELNVRAASLEQRLHDQTAFRMVLQQLIEAVDLAFQVV